MIFDKLFKKYKKEIKDSIKFNFDDTYINIEINFNDLDTDIKNFFEMSLIELEDIIQLKDRIFKIKHEDVYRLEREYLDLFQIPLMFKGNIEVSLRGLINQNNASFDIKVFNPDEVFPYEVKGSIFKISEEEEYLLPKNLFEIFSQYKVLNKNNEYEMYSFIEILQEDTSDKIRFIGLSDNDFIRSVKNITIDIKEDSNHDLIITPKIDDLSTDKSDIYEKNIEKSKESLLITEVDKESKVVNRYLLDKKDIGITKTINKTKKILKKDVSKFMSNPTSFFECDNIELEEELSQVFDFGYRIMGIGEPYLGYFGSVQIDTPLSDVLKKDPEFIKIVDTEHIKEFIEDNNEDLAAIRDRIQDAQDNSKPEIIINDTQIKDFEYNSYIKNCDDYLKKNTKTEEGISNKDISNEVLKIKSNDEDNISYESAYEKNLKDISIDNEDPANLYLDFEFKPKQHQVVALNWLIDLYKSKYSGCLLADDMGLGKTFEVISFINFIIKKTKGSKILIVAPTILIDNWNNEFENSLLQESKENYKIKIIRGGTKALDNLDLITKGKKTKAEALQDMDTLNFVNDYNIYITTYKTLQKYQFAWAFMAEDPTIGIECIVYDEAQNIKNPNALQTQASKAISSLCKFNILLSGTPIENELRDIWCLFDVFDPLFFGSWKNFRKDFVNNIDNVEKRLREKISNYMLRRLKNQVLNSLPNKFEPKIDITLPTHYPASYVSFNKKQTELYDKIINSDAVALTKLRQLRLLSMHPILLDDKASNIEYFLKNDILNEYSKTKELLNKLDFIKSKDEKVIIFVISKNMQILLKSTLSKKYGINIHVVNGDNNKSNSLKNMLDDYREINGFNIIILSTIAAGVGLTLNEANHVIHYERHWNPSKEDQASDRVYRIGQTKDVYIHHLISKFDDTRNSFDEGLNQLIMNKKSMSEDTLIPTSTVSEKDLANILMENSDMDSLSSIDTMNPYEFENFVKEIYIKKGYSATLTEKVPSEYGADVIARKGTEIIAIQCKHSCNSNKFNKEAMRQLHSESLHHYKATKLIAITNSYFNKNAMDLAKVHTIEVIDRESIVSLINLDNLTEN